jgi:hypothetical protein
MNSTCPAWCTRSRRCGSMTWYVLMDPLATVALLKMLKNQFGALDCCGELIKNEQSSVVLDGAQAIMTSEQ